MPCSSPKHALAHIVCVFQETVQGLGLKTKLCEYYVLEQTRGSAGGSGDIKGPKRARVYSQRYENWHMQQNKLLLWSERGIWLGLSHVHLPRRHLIGSGESHGLPMNWWEDLKVLRLELWRYYPTGSKYHVKGECTWVAIAACVYVCVRAQVSECVYVVETFASCIRDVYPETLCWFSQVYASTIVCVQECINQ